MQIIAQSKSETSTKRMTYFCTHTTTDYFAHTPSLQRPCHKHRSLATRMTLCMNSELLSTHYIQSTVPYCYILHTTF